MKIIRLSAIRWFTIVVTILCLDLGESYEANVSSFSNSEISRPVAKDTTEKDNVSDDDISMLNASEFDESREVKENMVDLWRTFDLSCSLNDQNGIVTAVKLPEDFKADWLNGPPFMSTPNKLSNSAVN